MTVMAERGRPVTVCVLSVDSPYGHGAQLQRSYSEHGSPGVAKLFAGRFVEQMKQEGSTTCLRGVFISEDNKHWKTAGSYFDV